LDQIYITKAEFQDVYDHARRTRAAISGFIDYLTTYEQKQRNKDQPNPKPRTQSGKPRTFQP
jgi:hypothetical protein